MATEILRPKGVGSETSITSQTPSGGEHWDKVGEEVLDDNTRVGVSGGAEYLRDLYALPASEGSGTINKVTVFFRCKSSYSGRGGAKASIKPNSIITDGDAKSLTKSYQTFSQEWANNPADGQPWGSDWSVIDALEAGVSLWSQSGYSIDCSWLYVVVDYTLAAAPIVTTQAASSVNKTSAILNGNIIDIGGATPDYRGFVWNTSSHEDPGNTAPTDSAYGSNWTQGNSYGTGPFSHGISGLIEDQTYYYRACAHNSYGWSYGDEVTFVPTAPWSLEGAKRIKLTIDHTDIDSALSDFPILVHLGVSVGRNNDDVTCVFDELQSDANRKKIAVTASDGITQCYVEIEKWDDANEEAWLWVKVPDIDPDTDTDLYLYYDSSKGDNTDYVGDPDSTPAESVWDSHFKAVWHLRELGNGTAGEFKDSTNNNKDGQGGGGTADYVPTQVDGQIGKGQDHDGLNDWIDIPDSIVTLANDFMVEMWVKPNPTSNPRWLSMLDPSNNFEFGVMTTNKIYARIFDAANQTEFEVTYGEWHRFIFTKESGVQKVYVDKEEKAISSGGIGANANFSAIGGGYTATSYTTDGVIDEVRISDIVRTAAWFKASYESEIDDLLDFGSEEMPPAGFPHSQGVIIG